MANEFCGKCGATLNDAQFCPSCGTAAVQVQTQPKPQPAPPPVSTPAQVYMPVCAVGADVPPPKDSRYSVMGTGSFMGSILLFSIPLVGFIFMVVWACGGCKNQNKRNLARAYLFWLLIGIVVTAAVALIFASLGTSLYEELLGRLSRYYY